MWISTVWVIKINSFFWKFQDFEFLASSIDKVSLGYQLCYSVKPNFLQKFDIFIITCKNYSKVTP